MSGTFNKVLLVGRLGQDADVRYTGGGTAVATLSLATDDVWNDKDGKQQKRTDWHRIVIWGKVAETLKEYLVKGKQILVEGKLQTRNYDKDGQKRYITEVRSDRVVLLGGKAGDHGGAVQAREDEAQTIAQASGRPDEDDIPF